MAKQPGEVGRWPWVSGGLLLLSSLAGAYFLLPGPRQTVADTVSDAEWNVVCTGHVDAESGVTQLTVMVPGRVVEVLAKEGQHVAAGATLLKLDDAAARLHVDQAKAAEETALLALELAKKAPEQHRLLLEMQQQAVEAANFRLTGAQLDLVRGRELVAAKSLSESEFQANEAKARGLQSAATAEDVKLRELKLADPTLKVRQAEADLRSVRVKVAQAEHLLTQCTLTAPVAGYVLRVAVAVGDVAGVSPHTGIQFRAEGRLVVRAEVEQEFAGKVKPGQSVEVRDEASVESPSWRGKVDRLSDWITRRRSVLLEPDRMNDVRTLEAVIRLDEVPNQQPLRIGQSVRVTIRPR